MAAELGLPYVFALFLNSDEAAMDQAVTEYRANFSHLSGQKPVTMLALPVILADTDAQAESLASAVQVVRIRLANGRSFTLTTVEAAEEFGRQSGVEYQIEVRPASVIHGAPDTAGRKLDQLQARYDFDEIMAVSPLSDFGQRRRTFELLGQLLEPATA
jgi:alkanesulfonate monooxygenase SsuD/methylene tetrahydromethanopterin reductase-like flavin-dependent oxidoreductase (luciferase family)